ncbi:MAG: deoxyguanosinetriphosphate triphosphohydrolase [Candidatus Mycalebacterium zealandia]|nr:MAG: deoxyguanosinetriphosphate triphosphohydrolase [Candidatus Mycalebacterium zealandia]
MTKNKTIREQFQKTEKLVLSPHATLSSESKGRARPEDECSIRNPFQRDRDRIVHSKSFRRMKHKTQVFLSPTNDHYRTRLTHVIEVSQIARTIARALFLNEDLTEAIALGHDLGHTPFGHAGERALNEVVPDGFFHVKQSVRVVECLENNGKGLNLTYEVIDGITKHSKGRGPIDGGGNAPETLEGQVVRISDLIAYANHDIDDALRSEIIKEKDLPHKHIKIIGKNCSERLDRMVRDIVSQTTLKNYEKISISPEIEEAIAGIREYLFNHVYLAGAVNFEAERAVKMVKLLYRYFCDNKSEAEKRGVCPHSPEDSHERAVCDFVASMTDSYAVQIFREIFVPSKWRDGRDA